MPEHRRSPAEAAVFQIVDPASEIAISSMTAYFDELGRRFDDGFDPGDTLVADAGAMRAPNGVFVIATIDDRTAGCGGVQRIDDETGEIKRMWVVPGWRGVGLGRHLLQELEGHVARHGHRRVVLDTNSVLTEAIAMYQRAGYREIEAYNDNPYARHWFEKHLNAE